MSEFSMSACPACDAEVLLYWDVQDGDLVSRCIHCETALAEGAQVSAARLIELGYSVEGYVAEDAERGCRDGQCGVRQPKP